MTAHLSLGSFLDIIRATGLNINSMVSSIKASKASTSNLTRSLSSRAVRQTKLTAASLKSHGDCGSVGGGSSIKLSTKSSMVSPANSLSVSSWRGASSDSLMSGKIKRFMLVLLTDAWTPGCSLRFLFRVAFLLPSRPHREWIDFVLRVWVHRHSPWRCLDLFG